MRPFTSPDELMYRYIEKREQLGSAKTLSIKRAEGYKFAAKCVNAELKRKPCKSTVWAERLDGSGFVCFRCGAPWKATKGQIMPAEIDCTPRPGRAEDPFVELVTLERLLAKLTIWERRVWYDYLLADLSEFDIDDSTNVLRKRRNVDALVLYLRRKWPRATHSWYRGRVWGLVKSAREKATKALCDAGYWEGE